MTETDFCPTYHFSSSFDTLNIMRRDNRLCDIQFIIGDKKVSAHKNVLASFSEYFHNMFCGNFNNSKVLEINNNEITPNSFELLVDFMYTSRLRINDSNVQELLKASSFLLIGNVKEECLKFLKQTISVENLIEIRDMSVLYKKDELYDSCLSYALKNYNDIVKSHVFLSIPYELFIKLIQSDDLCAVEEIVFESVMLWMKHDIVGRSKHLLDLLKAIRLCIMSIDYLHNYVQKEELIESNIECMKYLFKVLVEKGNGVHESSSTFNFKPRKCFQLILSMWFDWLVNSSKLQLMWFTVGSKIYKMKTIMLDAPIRNKYQCLILSDGRIVCVRCSKCNKRPSSMFDGNTKTWYTLCDFRLCTNSLKCYYYSLVELDGCMYVMSDHGYFNCYNIKKKKWYKLKGVNCNDDDISEENYFRKLIVSDGLIYLVNKYGVFQYCKNTKYWQSMSRENIIFEGDCFAGCCLNGFLYIFGGRDSESTPLKSAMKFNLSTKTWSNIADMHHARWDAGATVVNGLIYVIGGYNCDSVEVYDSQLDKWTLFKTKLPTELHSISNVIGLNPTGNINPDNIANYYTLND